MKSEEQVRAKLKETEQKIDLLLKKPSLASFLVLLLQPAKETLKWVLEEDC